MNISYVTTLIRPVLMLIVCSAGTTAAAELFTPAEIMALPAAEAGAGTSGVAGIRTRILAGNPVASGPYTIALYVPAQTTIAAHHHSDERSVVVISGTWHFGFGSTAVQSGLTALPPGSFYTEPADSAHFAQTATEPVIVYISGFGPSNTVYEAQSPP